jgi:glycosyltransferase involved in cell wall biosynthesis
MRIGIVATKLDHDVIHGHGRYTLELLKNLNLFAPPDIEIIVIRRKKGWIDDIDFEQVFIPNLSHGNSVYEILKIRDLGLDLIHYPYQNLPLFFPFLKPRKIVATIHGAGPEVLPKHLRTRNPSPLLGFKWTRLSKHFDSIITVSDVARKDVSRVYGIAEERISVVYPGIDRNSFRHLGDSSSVDETAGKYGITLPLILHVSNLKPVKNLDLLLAAFKELKKKGAPHSLVIAGGDDRAREHYRNQSRSLGIDGDIRWVGYVYDEDLLRLYNAANVFVFPSVYESFGFPFLEAMACGCPAIASMGTAMEEIGGEAGVYVDANSVSDLASAMRMLIEDKAFREEKIQRGLKRAERFNWERSVSDLLTLYRENLR